MDPARQMGIPGGICWRLSMPLIMVGQYPITSAWFKNLDLICVFCGSGIYFIIKDGINVECNSNKYHGESEKLRIDDNLERWA
jgi:hypothetical protein